MKIEPKTQFETTAVIISWETPANLAGNAEVDVKYLLKYCEINTQKCANTTLDGTKTREIIGLKQNFLYNYAIYAVGKDNTLGEVYESTFRTKARST